MCPKMKNSQIYTVSAHGHKNRKETNCKLEEGYQQGASKS